MLSSPPIGERIDGLDVARAIAIFGMFAAHIANDGSDRSPGGWDWLWIAHGRPSALFAILAGVSISLMVARRAAGTGGGLTREDAAHTRVRIATRGTILIVAGYTLDVLGTPVDIILANLGLMFLLSLVAIRWHAVWLAVAAAVFVGAGSFAVAEIHPRGEPALLPPLPVLEKMWSDHYPALAWMGYILAGMAIGTLALRAGRVQAWLAGAGAALAIAAYTAGPALGGAGVTEASARVEASSTAAWASVAPHSYTPFEMAGNLGFAMLVIGACVFAAQRARALLWPLMAVGSMAFTAYVAQILVIWAVGEQIVWEPSNTAFVVLCAATTAFACFWRRFVGQGPLERLMTLASSGAADALVPATAPTLRQWPRDRHPS